MALYKKVALGGTFDHLHKGHKKLIKKAFQLGSFVLIGLTSDKFVRQRKETGNIQSFKERKMELENYIKSLQKESMCEIIKLDDEYGPAISDPDLEALIVSTETVKTADEINSLRVRRKLKPLKIHVEDLVLANNGEPISSSKIRAGLITPNGEVY